ncbi:hypothetical protein B0H10DRAFT_2230830 [Mycena sp. CBHHK59/15]|nr:hypothetical protein B0H10DRAFT_2230830 [Mycena sp. CBHHK59/15]
MRKLREGSETEKPRKRKQKQKQTTQNSDPDDDDFSSGGASDDEDSDSDIEGVIPNDELAASLPTKTVPENAKHRTENTRKPPVKKKKTQVPPTAVLEDANVSAGPSNQAQLSASNPKPKAKAGTRSQPIYLFYEEVTPDHAEPTSLYYKSYFGNREVLEMTQSSNYNTRKLQNHLKHTSPSHFRLYEVLKNRSGPVTDRERKLACGVKKMTDAVAKEYEVAVKNISNNLKEMFQKQRADAQVPWD